MALTRYKLGDLIEQRREKFDNESNLPIRGVSRDGFIDARQPGADLSLYNVFYYGDFVFNPARMELNSIAYNRFYDKAICSSLYEIFFVKRTDILLPEYLNLFVKRNEFARLCEYIGWGSAREYCRFGNISGIDITLPSIEQQQKFVNVYMALQNNLAVYQSKVDDLKKVCDEYINKLKSDNDKSKIGGFIELSDERNENDELGLNQLRGISTDKIFIDTKADMLDVKLTNYKIVHPNEFAYVADTSRRGDKIALAFNDSEESYLISSIYTVFKVNDDKKLNPFYLMMFFTQNQFNRYARFNSWGSARETFDWPEMCDVRIPIPSIDIQNSIASLYKAFIERQRIAAQLKERLNILCPILIKGSLETGN